MAMIKYSRQRESIKEYLAGTKEHPTADMGYRHVCKVYPNISLGTVYRNLNFLVEHDEAARLLCGDGVERFDGNMAPHYHVVCKRCKKVSDLSMDSLEHINTLAAARFGGTIEGHSVIFYGLCPACALESRSCGDMPCEDAKTK